MNTKHLIDKKSLALALMLVLCIVIALLFVNISNLNNNNEKITGHNVYNPSQPTTNQQTINLGQCNELIHLEYLPEKIVRRDFNEEKFKKFLAKIQPYKQHIKEASAHYNIPEELIIGIMKVENAGGPFDYGTYTIKDGSNSKVKVKRLCNGRCGLCKFAGGPGNEYNCMEDQKKCHYYDKEKEKWTISSSTAYCNIMQTSIENCEKLEKTGECNLNEFMKGNPKDGIFTGAEHIRGKLNSYLGIISKPPYDKIPAHNLYWGTAFAYNNGQGTLKIALREITKNKYNGDYSKFNWWELTTEDFEVIMHLFSDSVKDKSAVGRVGYAQGVLKALKYQGFDGCNGGLIIGEKGLQDYLGNEKYTKQLSTPELIPMDFQDRFIYQIDPSFSISLTHELDIYAKLREKSFLIAKEVEKCHEQKNIDENGEKITTINAGIIEECVKKEINKNKEVNFPPKLNLEICDKDVNKASYTICAKSNENLNVYLNNDIKNKPLIYRFALGFKDPSLKNVNIETIKKIKEDKDVLKQPDKTIEQQTDTTTKTQQTITDITPGELTQITNNIPSDINFYTYTTKCKSKVEPFEDRTEGIILPKSITSNTEVYFYFHGHQMSGVESYVKNKKLAEKVSGLHNQGKDIILVWFKGGDKHISSEYTIKSGPFKGEKGDGGHDWMKGKRDGTDESQFKCFYDEAIATITQELNQNPTSISFMGHSNGGRTIRDIYIDGGFLDEPHLPIKSTIYFDACYGTWCTTVANLPTSKRGEIHSYYSSQQDAGNTQEDSIKLPNYPDSEVKVTKAGHGSVPANCFLDHYNEQGCLS